MDETGQGPPTLVQHPIFQQIDGVLSRNRMCLLFPFRISGILATRYAGTTIARLGQANRVCKGLPVDTRAEFIGRQPNRDEVLQTLRHRIGFVRHAGRVRTTTTPPPFRGVQTGRAHGWPRLATVIPIDFAGKNPHRRTSWLGRNIIFRLTSEEFVSVPVCDRNSGFVKCVLLESGNRPSGSMHATRVANQQVAIPTVRPVASLATNNILPGSPSPPPHCIHPRTPRAYTRDARQTPKRDPRQPSFPRTPDVCGKSAGTGTGRVRHARPSRPVTTRSFSGSILIGNASPEPGCAYRSVPFRGRQHRKQASCQRLGIPDGHRTATESQEHSSGVGSMSTLRLTARAQARATTRQTLSVTGP